MTFERTNAVLAIGKGILILSLASQAVTGASEFR